MRSIKLPAFTAALILCLGMASCGNNAEKETSSSPVMETSSAQTEPTAEETVPTFTPIEITDDYTGEILGVKNWHIEKNTYYWEFYNDDTGDVFAFCTCTRSVYLADLNGDGQPELVINGSNGNKSSSYANVFKLENGIISVSAAEYGESPIKGTGYHNFAKANGLDINDTNVRNFTDVYDPERNKIFITDSSTNTEYECKWEYFDFYTFDELDRMIAAAESSESDTDTPSDDIEISYKTDKPDIKDISDTEKELTFHRDDKELEGRLFLPEDEGDHPVVVLSCGLEQPYTDYVKKAKGFAENGYAAVVYTFADYTEDDIHGQDDKVFLSEAADLNAVLDSLGELPDVDTDSVYLWGHSFGGLTCAYVGCTRDGIKAVIGAEPSLPIGDDLKLGTEPPATLRIYSLMKDLDKPMLIFMGTHDGFGIDPHAFDDALAASDKVELKIIDGADHFFEGEAEDEMVRYACMFMDEIEAK